MDILFIANLVPFPLDGGGKIKTFTSIKALSQEYTVDLVCFYEKEDIKAAKAELSKYCREVVMLPIKVTTSENIPLMIRKAVISLFSRYSLNIYKYRTSEMENALLEMVKKNHYTVTYFDHLQVYSYKKKIACECPGMKFVLDTHNCEALIYKRYVNETANILKKIYLYIETYKLKQFESYAVNDVDRLIVLSESDKSALEKMCGRKIKCSVVPIGVDAPEAKKTIDFGKKEIDILFLGTLTWAPNNEGMIWFMQKVMPLLCSKIKFHLYIVGKNPSTALRELAGKYENVTLTGYVTSVIPYYEKCDFIIVPLFFGSGQRVKIIESFSYGMPVISTTIGAEGLNYTNGKDILIADDEQDFVNMIGKLCDKDMQYTLSENGRHLYEQFYSVDAVGRQIICVVQGLEKTGK